MGDSFCGAARKRSVAELSWRSVNFIDEQYVLGIALRASDIMRDAWIGWVTLLPLTSCYCMCR